jgi:hypothetical protein
MDSIRGLREKAALRTFQLFFKINGTIQKAKQTAACVAAALAPPLPAVALLPSPRGVAAR